MYGPGMGMGGQGGPMYSYSPPIHPDAQGAVGFPPASPSPSPFDPAAVGGFPGMPSGGMGAMPQGRQPMPNLFANILNGGLGGGFGGPPAMGHPAGMMPQHMPVGQPMAPSYAPHPQYSYAPPPQIMAEPRPVQQQPVYMPQAQPGLSYVPQQQPAPSYAPPAMAAQPAYGQPARVVQYSQNPAPAPAPAPAAPTVERILVTISGREGVNDVINGAFQSIGEHGGRYSFSKPTNEGPIYLYYDQASDNWCIGDQIGSQSYYAVCGPSNGQDMAQQWRVWTGDEWEVDMRMTATIH